MGWTVNAALGALVHLWCNVQRYAPDGVVTTWTEDDFARFSGVHPRLKASYSRVLSDLQLLRSTVQGVVIAGWDEHNQWAKRQRRLEKDRNRKKKIHGKSTPREEKRRGREEKKSLKTLAPLGARMKAIWQAESRKDLANAVVIGSERERNGNRMARGADKALYSNAMKIVRVVEDLEVTPDEYLDCVRFHATAVYGKDGHGYKQTWGAFAGAFPAIIGEIRRGPSVPANQKQLTDGVDKWLQRKGASGQLQRG